MARKPIHFTELTNASQLACEIAQRYDTWRSSRAQWTQDKKELRDYIFATDTRTTSNATLPWKNSTTTPKICQIRDNLHANYLAALFPNSKWVKWVGEDKDSVSKETADLIETYMLNKLQQMGFESVISRALYDYIDFGVVFGEVHWEDETHTDPNGFQYSAYRGPKLERISPYELMFDISATSFDGTAKIKRSIISYGSLASMVANQPEDAGWAKEALSEMSELRSSDFYGSKDVDKSHGFQMDGFSSFAQYLQSGNVEILEFEGDIYDEDTKEYLHNHRIIVGDRSKILWKGPISSWVGRGSKVMTTWRKRPDNLIGMGPLDNLVGMQYRIDHLENLKADVFDAIAFPISFERGHVGDWQYRPGEKIQGDENSDVRFLTPDTTALNADFQIQHLMNLMEEMAGAPKEAMGIRTPGEKTAFEVQSLQNAAGRIFQAKIRQFEVEFLEPALNIMLEVAVRNMDGTETIKVVDSDLGVAQFKTITKEDITAKGKLVPLGARHYAERANAVQTLNQMAASALYQDPSVRNNISAKALAKAFVTALDIGSEEDIYGDNIRIAEDTDAAMKAQAAQSQLMQNAATQPELEE